MLVSTPGQFFVPHQDSEKADDMVASLVVALPGNLTGGALRVTHRGETSEYRSSKHALSFVAFYADCFHEVRPVRAGNRIVFTYNLLLAGATAVTPQRRHAQRSTPGTDRLVAPRSLAVQRGL
jgi:hypothetical protein